MASPSTLLAVFGVLVGTAFVCVLGEFVCPSKNGFFPDPEQCDMYYECRKGVAKPKLCGDGMAFLGNNPLYARCDFLSNVDCASRPYLQEAKSTPKCPRANGYFPHEDPQNCAEFYTCSNGVPSKLNCQKGLAFNPQVGGCEWAGRVPGCEHEARNAQVPSGVSTSDSADVDEE